MSIENIEPIFGWYRNDANWNGKKELIWSHQLTYQLYFCCLLFSFSMFWNGSLFQITMDDVEEKF